ncbi:MAG: pullulanase [Rhodothermales bacterium]|nr:pullulanase [Rhodothermales bacterium]
MKKNFLVSVLLTLVFAPAFAQEFSADEVTQGYAESGADVTFIFDAATYGIVQEIDRVVVTGSFSDWDQDMQESDRQLNRAPGSDLWTLRIENPDYSFLSPSAQFKFRINAGEWLDPPANATNVAAGNLVYLQDVQPVRASAELHGSRAVWLTVTGDHLRSLDPSSYKLMDASGRSIAIIHAAPNTATETLLVPAEELDVRRVYYLEVDSVPGRVLCSRDAWFKTLYSDKVLGAEADSSAGRTSFRIFSPRAERVRLFLYEGPDDSVDNALDVIELVPDRDGVWEATVERDLAGIYYDFTVHGPPDPGNYFYETHPVHISDPYARANVDAFGKSRVMYPTVPAAPIASGIPRIEDVVAYEVHVQDFTDRLPVADRLKGTFPAMVESGLTNSLGHPIGLDHIVELGINTVHLMPVQEYLHYPDDEWRTAFTDDPYMIEQGVATENYQWGYRTTHAFAIENRFRAKDTDYGSEREQFRDLVQAFHDEGIAVIIDIIPNHTGENMDGRHYLFNFNVLDKPFYYRTNSQIEHIGPFGNEIKTENRPMVQRWIIDQCVNLIREFGIDGFRIDLAGQIDEQTLIALRKAVGDDIIIYGEPWIAPSDPDVAANPDWAWYKEDAPITYFQDGARNAFKGPVSNPVDPVIDRGFAGGDGSVRDETMLGLANRFPDEREPSRGINYLDIHDNWALADRFAINDWDGRLGVEEERFKIAATLLFTSLGPIVLHGGTEFMRSKGHAPLEEIVKTTASGDLYYHGKRDTYNLRIANQFVWENIGRTPSDGAANDYANMLDYWEGLVDLRMSDSGSVFRVGERQSDDYYQWILPRDTSLLGYVVDRSVIVLINASDTTGRFTLPELQDGNWKLVANGQYVDIENGVDGSFGSISTGAMINLPGTVAAIWVLTDSE